MTVSCTVASDNAYCAAPTKVCIGAAIIPLRIVYSTIDVDWVDTYEAVAA